MVADEKERVSIRIYVETDRTHNKSHPVRSPQYEIMSLARQALLSFLAREDLLHIVVPVPRVYIATDWFFSVFWNSICIQERRVKVVVTETMHNSDIYFE